MKMNMFSRVWIAGAVVTACLMASTAGADLIHYYAMDEASGAAALDSAGDMDGTYVAAPTLGVASKDAGLYGTAVEFNGSSQYVNLGSGLGSMTDQFTIAAWIKSDIALSGYHAIVSMNSWAPATGLGWGLEIKPNGTIQLVEPGYQSYDSSVAIGAEDAGQWVHVAVTFDSTAGDTGEVKYYKNGELLDALTQGSLNAPVRPFQASVDQYNIGNWAGDYFDGAMDEVRIYDSALSGGEIAQLAGVPEPSTFMLLATGMIGMLAFAWRKAK